jgi:hypothetical protein
LKILIPSRMYYNFEWGFLAVHVPSESPERWGFSLADWRGQPRISRLAILQIHASTTQCTAPREPGTIAMIFSSFHEFINHSFIFSE